jgi:hypothetical protein
MTVSGVTVANSASRNIVKSAGNATIAFATGVATLSAANPHLRDLAFSPTWFRAFYSQSSLKEISMRYAILLPLALVGLAGCVTTQAPAPTPTTTTYVAPPPPTSTTTVIRTP